ncbi:MAG TPA: hypothetical protein VFL82_15655 [Thermomicrobiales bacterium]|nr:hypothetical protein [Thermomicrobiales bacterium]
MTRIEVAARDALPDVLERLRAAAKQSVELDIPDGSSLFLTANEFRALRTIADQEQINLTLHTDDPLRQQLAAMFRLKTSANDAIANGRDPSWGPGSEAVSAKSGEAALDDELVRRAWPAWDLRRRWNSLRPAVRRRALVAAGSTVAVLVLVALIGGLLFLPLATVSLNLAQQPVSGAFVYDVVLPGAQPVDGADLTLAAQPIETDVTFTQTIKSTGTRKVPDKAASGDVQLSNPNPKEITIEKGTVLTGYTGVHYAVTDSVKVPAGNPDKGLFGKGTVHVAAQDGGATGNLIVGDLSGKLDSGVYFSNREQALTGGTDRTVAVVSEADLDTLRATAEAGIPDLATKAAEPQMAGGEALVGPSITHGDITYAFDHKVDEEADKVTVTATTHVTALKYNAAEARNQARDALNEKLAATAPAGLVFAPSTLSLDEPALVTANQGSAQFRIVANAKAVTAFSHAQRRQLADDLAGKSDAAARQRLTQVEGVDRADISYRPGWWPERMPRLAKQIEITLIP